KGQRDRGSEDRGSGHLVVPRAPLQSREGILAPIDPTDYRNFEDWFRLMMSCFVAGVDCEEFVSWSTNDPLYADVGDEIRRMWSALKPNGEITEATLFRALKGEPVVQSKRSFPIPPKHRRKMTPRDRARIS